MGQGRRDVRGRAGPDPGGRVAQHLGQLGDVRLPQPLGLAPRVRRQQRRHGQRDRTPDEGVLPAVQRAVRRAGQCDDEDGLQARLGDGQPGAAQRHGDEQRDGDDHADLPGALPDQLHQQVPDEDARRHPHRQLRRAAQPGVTAQAQGDDGGHRREVGPRVPQHLGGHLPGRVPAEPALGRSPGAGADAGQGPAEGGLQVQRAVAGGHGHPSILPRVAGVRAVQATPSALSIRALLSCVLPGCA